MDTQNDNLSKVQKWLAAARGKGEVLRRWVLNRNTLARLWPLFAALFMVGIVLGAWRGNTPTRPHTTIVDSRAEPGPETAPAPVSPELQSIASAGTARYQNELNAALRAEQNEATAPVSEKDFVRPCPGRVAEKFGWQRDSALGTWRLQAGVFLAAARGTPVVAIAPGKVARVEQDSLHGVLVAVDHDSHWRSIYGRLSDVTVTPGDPVTSGEILARVGNGPEGGYGVYFALYRDGEPQDPQLVIPGL